MFAGWSEYSGQYTADVCGDLFILAVCKEHLRKIWLTDGLLQEVLVDFFQHRENVLMGDLLDLGQDAAVLVINSSLFYHNKAGFSKYIHLNHR